MVMATTGLVTSGPWCRNVSSAPPPTRTRVTIGGSHHLLVIRSAKNTHRWRIVRITNTSTNSSSCHAKSRYSSKADLGATTSVTSRRTTQASAAIASTCARRTADGVGGSSHQTQDTAAAARTSAAAMPTTANQVDHPVAPITRPERQACAATTTVTVASAAAMWRVRSVDVRRVPLHSPARESTASGLPSQVWALLGSSVAS